MYLSRQMVIIHSLVLVAGTQSGKTCPQNKTPQKCFHILFIYCFSYNNIIGQRVVPSPKFRHRARESKCNNFVMQGHQIVTKTVIHKNNVKPAHFYRLFCLHINYMHYICNVFFMVLELRLTKIGCREDNQFFLF